MKKEIGDFPLILLAGGRSSRMGTPKGLLDYQGHPWLVEQLLRFKAASGRQAIIVLGFHQALYFEQIPWLEKAVKQPEEQLRTGNFSGHQSDSRNTASSLPCSPPLHFYRLILQIQPNSTIDELAERL